MAGKRHEMDSQGTQYEKIADSLLTSIASMVSVPRADDFGVDFYLHPRHRLDDRSETVAGLAALQVKGGDATLKYGVLDSRGRWPEHEFSWLMSLATPLYLAQVAKDLSSVQVFSMGPLWRLFLQRPTTPFEVSFTTQPPSADTDWQLDFVSEHSEDERLAGGRWTVNLGPPIIRVTSDDLSNRTFRSDAAVVLRTWITQDRLNLMRFHQAIPVATVFTAWKTNSVDGCAHRFGSTGAGGLARISASCVRRPSPCL